ncbi:hypothetical protein RHSIM_Rhsim01G0070900 [Rhododendron simsii]|uniref:Uncharacterized protein n=1 Tax=Rhododendron simsii TaxID=118357 RepID=A0A834LVL0_RHOSS|nr:hypothetical protein RHSIM_Rhsim01G0070900 [Rhododendron simsii]
MVRYVRWLKLRPFRGGWHDMTVACNNVMVGFYGINGGGRGALVGGPAECKAHVKIGFWEFPYADIMSPFVSLVAILWKALAISSLDARARAVWDVEKTLGVDYDGEEEDAIRRIAQMEEIDGERYRAILQAYLSHRGILLLWAVVSLVGGIRSRVFHRKIFFAQVSNLLLARFLPPASTPPPATPLSLILTGKSLFSFEIPPNGARPLTVDLRFRFSTAEFLSNSHGPHPHPCLLSVYGDRTVNVAVAVSGTVRWLKSRPWRGVWHSMTVSCDNLTVRFHSGDNGGELVGRWAAECKAHVKDWVWAFTLISRDKNIISLLAF